MKANRTKGKPTGNRKAAPGQQPKKKMAKRHIALTVLAVGAAGILGYLTWQYIRKRKTTSSPDLDTLLPRPSIIPYADIINSNTKSATPPYIDSSIVNSSSSIPKPKLTTNTASNFPLKKGSKGEKVKAMQQALINKHGAAILPKYGADGDFGSETVAALKKLGLPTSIDETNYYVLVQPGSSTTPDKSALAGKLFDAANKKDFNAVIAALTQLSTKDDYRGVSEIFSKSRLRGVHQTLVNGLLGSFTSEDQKQKIRYEFIRMGLKYNGIKWSLDGIDGKPIVTVEQTTVWVNATESMPVPAMMVLGAEITRRLDYTLFENNSKYFLVPTKSVKYL